MPGTRWFILCLILAAICLAAAPAHAGYEFPICTVEGAKAYPAVSGNIVAWEDQRNYPTSLTDIYGKDLSTGREFPICTAPNFQWETAISGNIVVWVDGRSGSWDIYGYDLSTGREFPICTAPRGQSCPAISGNIVVWEDGRNDPGESNCSDIYGKDLSTGREFPICTAPGIQSYPAISANIVVWADARNGSTTGSDIWGKDLSTGREFPICSEPGNQGEPAISGSVVVWTDYRNWSGQGIVNSDIYGRDLTSGVEFPICTAPTIQRCPAICGNVVVWYDLRHADAANEQIYAFDLEAGTETLVCTSGLVQTPHMIAISGDVVVWSGARATSAGIYGYRLDGSYWPPDQYGPDLPPGHVRHFLTGQLHAHWVRDQQWGIPLGKEDWTAQRLADAYKDRGYAWLAPTEHHDKRPPTRDPGGLFEDPCVGGILHLGDSMEDTAEDSHILAAGFNSTAAGFNFGIVGTAPLDNQYDYAYRLRRLRNIRLEGGGLAFVAHPDFGKYLWSDQMLMHMFGDYDGIEVFNAGLELTPYRAKANAVATWTTLLAQGKSTYATAGDDFAPNYVGVMDRGCVTVVADIETGWAPTKRDITDKLRSGRFYASYAPLLASCGGAAHSPRIEGWWWDEGAQRARIRVSSATGIRAVRFKTAQKPDHGQEISLAQVGDSWEGSYSCTTDDKWVRAEVLDWLGRVSLTQPIWLDKREGATGQWQAGAPSRSGDTLPQKLVLDLAGAHLELPGADAAAQLWGNLVPVEERPQTAPPLGYFGYCYSFQTNVPVPAGSTLAIAYDPAAIQICREDALAIYHYDALTKTWAAVPGTLDDVNHTVSAVVSELGTYALSADLPEDTLAPGVSLLVSGGAVLLGDTAIAAEASDDNGVASVQFFLDETPLGTDTTESDGWGVTVDFSLFAQGNRTLRATAKDASGNEAEATVPVVVDSAVPAPGITISSPTTGAYLYGQLQASGTWSATKPVAGGVLSLGEFTLGALVPNAEGDGWTAEVTLPSLGAGPQTLRVTGSDEDGNEATAEISVNMAAAPILSSGYVMPASGDTTTRFTWRIKYWNTANLAPTSVWVAISADEGATPKWHRMWAFDPADTNYVDGAWFTYSSKLPAGTWRFRFAAEVAGQWVYWPQPTGTYVSGPTVAQANPIVLSSGHVMPTSGTGVTQFTWRVKYWNSLNAPPDEVKVAIWFPTLKTTYWYPMWALDPADTTYTDGKWYTYSRKWLPPGAYAYRFAARQGSWWAYWPAPAGTYASGPTVNP